MNTAELAFISALTFFSFGLLLIELLRAEGKRRDRFNKGSVNSRTLVIVPCRGRDLTLEENLQSLRAQSSVQYSIVAVVDSPDDEAVAAIKATGIELLISSAECSRCSGKVRAITTAIERYPDFDVYVIADSDGTYDSEWLAKLLSPLADRTCGISTTFPLFRPEGGFWSMVKLVWGFVGFSMMDSPITRFGWGGSLAFKRELIEGDGLSRFREAVSDDSELTHLCRSLGRRIAYVDNILVHVPSRESFSSFAEWSNRQTALAVSGNSMLLPFGVAYYGVRIFLLIGALAASVLISPLFLLLLAPFALSLLRIYRRSGYRTPLLVPLFFLTDFIYFVNLLKGGRSGSISWRGRNYQLR